MLIIYCADNIKKSFNKEFHLSIDIILNNNENGWTLSDVIIDHKNNAPENEFLERELQKELDKTENLDITLTNKLAERLTNAFINLGSNVQTIIIDSCINNTSDSKMGQKLGKYRKTVTRWKRKGLKTLKDEIEEFLCHSNIMDIHPKRHKRIIITALEQLLGKE